MRGNIAVFIIARDPLGKGGTTSLFRYVIIRQRFVPARWDRKA